VDVGRDSQREGNLRVFDELAELFRRRTDIPGTDEFPEVKPRLGDHCFPAHILDDAHMRAALDPDRLARLHRTVEEDAFGAGSPIVYAAPWYDTSLVPAGSIDWIFSQAVLEHVDDVPLVYRTCRAWIVPGGLMSHQIDFRSHGTAPTWDGHRGYSDFTWRLVRGSRSHLINRAPLSAHLALARESGFELLETDMVETPPTLARSALAPRFSDLTEQDRGASGAFVVHRLPL
jgi:hypothetical protein